MYAIIRAGGKQAKVRTGDVIDIEKVKSASVDMVFTPLLLVDDQGTAISDRAELAKASVRAKVVGETAGPKIDIFKYKAKTGSRKSQGHRQKYTTIEVTAIEAPGAKPVKKAEVLEEPVETVAAEMVSEQVEQLPKATKAAKSTVAKEPTAKKPVAKKPAAKKPAAKKE